MNVKVVAVLYRSFIGDSFSGGKKEIYVFSVFFSVLFNDAVNF
jgi:hypothetical protein